MDLVRSIFQAIKPKKNKNAAGTTSSAVQNPVTNQTSTISNDPKFITHIHHYHTSQGAPGSSTLGPALVTSYDAEQTGTKAVEWVRTTPKKAVSFSDRAVVAGYEGHDGSPLWVIRARYKGDLIPGKLAIKHHVAYVAWGGKENSVKNIEVCCARPEMVRWVEGRDGIIPNKAVVAGSTSSGEPLYVGRAKQQKSLTPGKVHPSRKSMYMSFAGKEVAHNFYEVLCQV